MRWKRSLVVCGELFGAFDFGVRIIEEGSRGGAGRNGRVYLSLRDNLSLGNEW